MSGLQSTGQQIREDFLIGSFSPKIQRAHRAVWFLCAFLRISFCYAERGSVHFYSVSFSSRSAVSAALLAGFTIFVSSLIYFLARSSLIAFPPKWIVFWPSTLSMTLLLLESLLMAWSFILTKVHNSPLSISEKRLMSTTLSSHFLLKDILTITLLLNASLNILRRKKQIDVLINPSINWNKVCFLTSTASTILSDRILTMAACLPFREKIYFSPDFTCPLYWL